MKYKKAKNILFILREESVECRALWRLFSNLEKLYNEFGFNFY